jgi:hypothetical protein
MLSVNLLLFIKTMQGLLTDMRGSKRKRTMEGEIDYDGLSYDEEEEW